MVTPKKRVLVVGSASLFGCAVGGLLETKAAGIAVESVDTMEMAIEAAPRVRPHVIVFCLDRDDERSGAPSRLRLMEAYPARMILCTLDDNHLMVYDTRRIPDATPEDLIAAVCGDREGSDDHNEEAI